MEHVQVFDDASKWAATPANNGGNGPTWQWGDEMLVGFTVGRFKPAESGHQCDYDLPFQSCLARTLDGGRTWNTWQPHPYAGRSGESADPQTALRTLNFPALDSSYASKGSGISSATRNSIKRSS